MELYNQVGKCLIPRRLYPRKTRIALTQPCFPPNPQFYVFLIVNIILAVNTLHCIVDFVIPYLVGNSIAESSLIRKKKMRGVSIFLRNEGVSMTYSLETFNINYNIINSYL